MGAQETHRELAAAARSLVEDAREAMAASASVRYIKDLMDVQASLFRSGDPVSAAREGDGMTSHLDAHAPAARTVLCAASSPT